MTVAPAQPPSTAADGDVVARAGAVLRESLARMSASTMTILVGAAFLIVLIVQVIVQARAVDGFIDATLAQVDAQHAGYFSKGVIFDESGMRRAADILDEDGVPMGWIDEQCDAAACPNPAADAGAVSVFRPQRYAALWTRAEDGLSLSAGAWPAPVPPSAGLGENLRGMEIAEVRVGEQAGKFYHQVYSTPEAIAAVGWFVPRPPIDRAQWLRLSFGIVLAAGVAVLLAVAIVRATFQARVRRINAVCDEVARGRLELRIREAANDEIGVLCGHVDRMLERIADLMSQTEAHAERAAHQLRTPLATLRLQIDRGLAQGDVAGAQAGLSEAASQLDDILRRYDRIHRLSMLKAQSGLRAGFSSTRLDEIVEAVREVMEPLAEEKGVALRIVALDAAVVNGDAFLLTDLVQELLSNAIKYCAEEGSVTVRLTREASRFSLIVEDDGAGFAPEALGLLGRNRANAPAPRGAHSSGLGWSLIAAIAEAHGFTAHAGNGDKGARVEISGAAAPT